MLALLAVFLGGSIGASLRFLLSSMTSNSDAPYLMTMLINVLGSIFLGFVTYIAMKKDEKGEDDFNHELKLFLTTGIAGGFTTFSTFNYEIFTLFQNNQVMTGVSYMFGSLFLGLFSIMFGMLLAKRALSAGMLEFFSAQVLVAQEDGIEADDNEDDLENEPVEIGAE